MEKQPQDSPEITEKYEEVSKEFEKFTVSQSPYFSHNVNIVVPHVLYEERFKILNSNHTVAVKKIFNVKNVKPFLA